MLWPGPRALTTPGFHVDGGMKHSGLAYCFAFATLISIAPPASAEPAPRAAGAEHRLTAADIRELARREVLWCDDYHSGADDCDAITLVRLSPDGKLAETTTLLISEGPRLQAFLGEVDEIHGDQVCNRVKAATLAMAFTLEGRAVSADAAVGLRSVLSSSLIDLDGKTVCQSFYRGADPLQLREEVTVDGKRREDLETTYQLREGGVNGFSLRPQVDKDKEKGQVV